MDRVEVMQLVRSFQCGYLTRREFVQKASLALGSLAAANALVAACAASPPSPSPVVEDATAAGASPEPTRGAAATATPGVEAGPVTYPGPDGRTLSGYLAAPSGASGLPGVVLIQEWWGLNEHIQDVTRRLAADGFVVLAPDLYDGVVVTEPDEARKLVMELDMATAVAEIQAAVDHLAGRQDVSGEKYGAVGFCMGGRLVLRTALEEERLGAVIPFYGTPLTPEEAAQVNGAVLGLYGAEDQGIPVADVQAMGAAFSEAGIPNEIQIYEGAGHAFLNDTRESYDPAASEDAWQRMLGWLRTYLTQTGA